jgi:hypothetical protein
MFKLKFKTLMTLKEFFTENGLTIADLNFQNNEKPYLIDGNEEELNHLFIKLPKPCTLGKAKKRDLICCSYTFAQQINDNGGITPEINKRSFIDTFVLENGEAIIVCNYSTMESIEGLNNEW